MHSLSPMQKLRKLAYALLASRRGLGGLILATASAQIIPVLTSPILTRLYTPDDFGKLAVFTGLMSVLGTVVTLRYESAIPIPKEDAAAKVLVGLSITLTVAIALVTGVIVWSGYTGLIRLPFIQAIQPYWWVVPLGLLMIGVYQTLSSWAVRKTEYPLLAATRLWQGLASAAAQVGLGLMASGPLGLFIGYLAGQSAGIRTLLRCWTPATGSFRGLFEYKSIKQAASRYRRFPVLSAPSAFLDSLGLALPAFFLSAYYDESIVGLYALTARVAAVPISVIGASVSKVYVGEAAEMVRTKPQEFPMFYAAVLKRMALFGLVGVLLPLLLVRPVIPIVFGPEWANAGIYLQILAPMHAVQFIAAPFGGTLELLERQDLHLLRELVRVLLTGLALWLGGALGLIPGWSIALLSIAGVGGYGVYLYVTKVAVDRWARANAR